MESSNLVDIKRDYSFFSPVHKAYSHIDYSLLDSKLISLADKIVYHPIVISDHAPLSMMLKVGEQANKKKR